MKFVISLLPALYLATVMADPVAKVSLDRAWGLLIGDELQLQIELPVSVDKLDPTSLPQIDKRYGAWLYLKELGSIGNNMVLTYQIVNVPTDSVVYTPQFNFRQLDDQWITVPEVAFTIGTLLVAANSDAATNALKADHKPSLISIDDSELRLKIASLLTIIFGLILAAWHIGYRPRNRLPFAQAVHELSRLKWSRSKQQDQAARILHAAFNSTAGTVMVHSKLTQLFINTPWLQPLETEIAQFYLGSGNHFFKQKAQQQPDLDTVFKLAKSCRSKERLA